MRAFNSILYDRETRWPATNAARSANIFHLPARRVGTQQSAATPARSSSHGEAALLRPPGARRARAVDGTCLPASAASPVAPHPLVLVIVPSMSSAICSGGLGVGQLARAPCAGGLVHSWHRRMELGPGRPTRLYLGRAPSRSRRTKPVLAYSASGLKESLRATRTDDAMRERLRRDPRVRAARSAAFPHPGRRARRDRRRHRSGTTSIQGWLPQRVPSEWGIRLVIGFILSQRGPVSLSKATSKAVA